MHVIAINGSPRKNYNTAQLLRHALKGAESKDATTELVHLYELDFKGCVSCFGCKLKTNKTPWRCVYRDGLSPVLEKIEKADALVLGSPIYLSDVTGEMRCFIERLLFPCVSYDDPDARLFPKKMNAAYIFTMGVPRQYEGMYDGLYKVGAMLLERLGGSVEILRSADACQFDDYSIYATGRFDPAHKKKIKETTFVEDRKKAFDIGARLS